MSILNLKTQESYDDWGILNTGKTKKIVLGDKTIEYDVFKIPVDILVYNASNGRIFIEAKRFENEEDTKLCDLKETNPEKFNEEVENIIWKTNEKENNRTKKDIAKYGQLDPGVVLEDGTIIDGNRRFTCIRKLHREQPDNDLYRYFEAAIVKVDGQNLTKKLLKEYEIKVQFGTDEKVDYNVINKNMHIYFAVEKDPNNNFNYSSMAELLGNDTTSGDVMKICKVCALVDEFLEYIGKPEEYQIAEDFNIYWPLEPLYSYFNNAGKNLSDLQKEQRKELFFDYLLTLNVALPTQTLRDNLLKIVFKNEAATDELIEKHKDAIGNDIANIISEHVSTDEFKDRIQNLKESEKSEEDLLHYQNIVDSLKKKNLKDLPAKLAKDALTYISDIVLEPFFASSSEEAAAILAKVKEYLTKISEITTRLLNDIEEHE